MSRNILEQFDDDEKLVLFCNSKVSDIISEVPDNFKIITELLPDNVVYVAPQEEFLYWLKGNANHLN